VDDWNSHYLIVQIFIFKRAYLRHHIEQMVNVMYLKNRGLTNKLEVKRLTKMEHLECLFGVYSKRIVLSLELKVYSYSRVFDFKCLL